MRIINWFSNNLYSIEKINKIVINLEKLNPRMAQTWQKVVKKAYPTTKSIRERTQRTYWYILCLGLTEVAINPGGVFLWLTHPNWGRIKNTNPRRKPDKNPPICAKLSTCGRIPIAKLMTMMKTRVNNAANWT